MVPVIPQQQEICIIRISPTTRRELNVIAELSAAMAAIKETAGLAKVINDAKTDAEVKVATIELQNKLITLQAECFSLGDAIRLRNEEIILLKAKIAEFENFQTQTEGYVLNQLESGVFVYSKEETVNGGTVTMHLCPKCFGQKTVSILQPFPVSEDAPFHESKCLHCENQFLMNKNPDYIPLSFDEIARTLGSNP
ncbi:hypothetical protein GT314_003090 [Salmonella enterica subsp. enterica]|nr:hypothetical protein [Salmonella enterica subsp. enterica serovar Kisangani]